MLIPLHTVVQDTSVKHIFNDLIYSLGLTVGLQMVEVSDKMGTKAFMKLFPKMCHKDRSSFRYDSLWNTVIADNVCNVYLCILPSPIPCANKY
jgi:hypothetical protein